MNFNLKLLECFVLTTGGTGVKLGMSILLMHRAEFSILVLQAVQV
jgi:hypothetical protein